MFYPQDAIGITGKESRNVFLNRRKAYHVKLHMVQFTREGMAKLGQFIQESAQHFGLHPKRIMELMVDNLYNVPPNQSLFILFTIPELDADVHVEIPKTFWRLTDFAREVPTFAPDGEQTEFAMAI